jgi:polar amino acid transport system ATP-binding protein
MLKIKNLSKIFGDIIILDNIELTIEKPRIVGLAGPSGSGKSTLLRLIQKLEIANSGTIECSARAGFMFQDFQLFPHMDVLNNPAIKSNSELNIYISENKSYQSLLAVLPLFMVTVSGRVVIAPTNFLDNSVVPFFKFIKCSSS